MGGDPAKLPTRIRYNYVCLLADQRRFTEAMLNLREIVANSEIAARAPGDPALRHLKAARPKAWKDLFGAPTEVASVGLIGAIWSEKLRDRKVSTVMELLDATSSSDRITQLAADMKIPTSLLLRWRSVAQLANLPAVAIGGANLLVDAGVETLPELATSQPEVLSPLVVAINQGSKRLDKDPTQDEVKTWVDQAKAAHGELRIRWRPRRGRRPSELRD